ncbi:Eukaryotic-type DNA primase large subunit [Klebsormidium nitens]|uniref:DNA primase large subunit n=1 Tax=Klebsormidium nitens TaxID=105231 RepID=A0A1Y1HVB4_KLENI|nr:Eukaryotic-type DNA primase large subunit [Klebsormidium nitens]|eukprot:GAQ82103.1 Eukaryotic-type DNA primase large subunit [Klebsormidium nitens]
MNFSNVPNKRKSGAASPLHGDYTASGAQLTMYQVPPIEDVALEEFEQFALDRLRVLKGVEEARSRGRKPDELESVVNDLWRKHMRMGDAAETTRKDIISHYVLRLAYCRTEDLRKWLLSQESALFRYRFRMESPDAQRRFLTESGLPYNPVANAELEAHKDKLLQVARSVAGAGATAESVYYKVPFEDVPELVAGRKVLLSKGWAYVPRDQLAALVVGHFRTRLSKSLTLTRSQWNAKIEAQEKDRLTPVVEALSSRYLGPDYSTPSTKAGVRVADVDALAAASFPLCMQHLLHKVRDDHHLKHGGRQQLGLFLKGIGLTLEDALTFWRTEFAQKFGVDKFDKEYAYNVRHNYGKEGKRTDYTPYSCIKIISSTPGVGDHHGCPYRHFSQDNLSAALGRMRLNRKTIDDVMTKVKNHHYQLACAATFEGVHGAPCESGINHPNQYFDESRKRAASREGDDPTAQGTPPVAERQPAAERASPVTPVH